MWHVETTTSYAETENERPRNSRRRLSGSPAVGVYTGMSQSRSRRMANPGTLITEPLSDARQSPFPVLIGAGGPK